MKKTTILAIVLCAILIATQSQATCWDYTPYSNNTVGCSVNTWTYDEGTYYISENSGISVTAHTVWSGLSGYSSYAFASDASGTVSSTADEENTTSYVFGSLAGTSGYINLYVNTQTSGYAYVQATW